MTSSNLHGVLHVFWSDYNRFPVKWHLQLICWKMQLLCCAGVGHLQLFQKKMTNCFLVNDTWNRSYVNCGNEMKWRNDRRSKRNLCNCVKKPEKNSGRQRGLNLWPRNTGEMLYQLSYEATDIGSRSFMDGKAKNIYFSPGGAAVEWGTPGNFLFPYFQTYFAQICCRAILRQQIKKLDSNNFTMSLMFSFQNACP